MLIKNLIDYLKNIPEDISHIEARHVFFCDAQFGAQNDYHMVKEVVHYKDGRVVPRTVIVENYERAFYVTKQGKQNHLEKKEWEKKENLVRYVTIQSRMRRTIAQVLSTMQPNPHFKEWSKAPRIIDRGVRSMMRNPWIYGADIKSTTLIKRTYQQRFAKFDTTPSTVAIFDVETNVLDGSEDITMATLSFGSRIVTAVDKNFVGGYHDVINDTMALFKRYMADDIEKRKINWELVLVDNPVAIIKHVFHRAHEWKPDIIGIWNINFDMPKVIWQLQKKGVKPEEIFCDPIIPKKYRTFEYIQGKNKMITASGKVKPLKWVEQWHTVACPASFTFIDQACAYKKIRTGAESDEPSYALDAIMKKHLAKRGKLKTVPEADKLGGLAWHKYMQTKHPLHYIVYNNFDCVGPELLDEATNDMRLTLPMMTGSSDYQDFSSQPRCSADNLHFFVQTKGFILGTTSDEMKHELDEYCVKLDGWICTLPAANIAMNGLKIIKELPNRHTNIYIHVGDLDVAASYPNGGAVFNVSKDTTVRELHRIDGVEYEDQREQGINLSGGHSNAVEFMTVICKAPELDAFLDAFLEDEGLPPIQLGHFYYPSTLASQSVVPVEEAIAA
jgi:hypothetical protein